MAEDRSSASRVNQGDGGEGGIRTHGTFRYNGFRDRPIRPLWHLSADLQRGIGNEIGATSPDRAMMRLKEIYFIMEIDILTIKTRSRD